MIIESSEAPMDLPVGVVKLPLEIVRSPTAVFVAALDLELRELRAKMLADHAQGAG